MNQLLICVNAALLAAVVVLGVWVAQLRARARQTSRKVGELSLTVENVVGWAKTELGALRSEFTVARVDASAGAVQKRRNKPPATAPAPLPEPADKERSAAPSKRADLQPPATRENAPGGAVAITQHLNTARDSHAEHGQTQGEELAALASEEKSNGERETALPESLEDVAAYNELVTATGVVDDDEDTRAWSASALAAALTDLPAEPNEEPRDTLATPVAPAPKPSNDDGEARIVLDSVAPTSARCDQFIRPPAPLAYPDLIGTEDAADEAARTHLDPDDPPPTRRIRAAPLLPAFSDPEGEST